MSAIEEKKTKPPDKSTDYFKCVKIPLKHVLKNPDINLPKITNAVIKCNKIVITPFSLKIGTLNYLVFSSYLFIQANDFINKYEEKTK